MPVANLIVPMWDYGIPMSDGLLGGIRVGLPNVSGGYSPVANPDYFNNTGFRIRLDAACGLLVRVREWTLAGSFVATDEGGTVVFEGTVNMALKATRYLSEVLMVDETDLVRCGGWYGKGGLTGTGDFAGDPDPDENSAFRFSAEWYRPGLVDELGSTDDHISVTYHRPIGGIVANDYVFSVGTLVEGDACPIVATLPSTGGGPGFDRYNVTGFVMELGGDNNTEGGTRSQAHVTGSLTLRPTRFWKYDPMDGTGAYYDENTGAWLRTPPYR